MEGSGETRGAAAGSERQLHQPGRLAEPPRPGLRRNVAGQLLELDRGLTLVADPVAHAEEGGDRVEQASHAGGERRVRLQALAHEAPLATAQADRRLEVGGGDPPGLPNRRLTAGQRHRVEPGEPLEALEIAMEELAAPDRPVGAKARAVEDERERRALLAVLGEARGRVRVVVLDADERQALLLRPLRREVLRMQVAGDRLGLEPSMSR